MKLIYAAFFLFIINITIYSEEADLLAVETLKSDINKLNEKKLAEEENKKLLKMYFDQAVNKVDVAKSQFVQAYQFEKANRAKDILAQLKKGNIPILSADDLIIKMNQAINIDALKDVNSFYVKMSFTGRDSGNTEIYSIKNKISQSWKLPKYEVTYGFDGKDTWQKYDYTNFLSKLNESEKDDVAQTSFSAWKDIKSYYKKIELSSEKFEGRDCYVLTCKNNKPKVPDKKYFIDKSTYLIAGYITTLDVWAEHRIMALGSNIDSKRVITTVINSYKKCENGLLYVDKMTLREGSSKTEFKLVEIKFNPTIDEKIFQRPNLKEL